CSPHGLRHVLEQVRQARAAPLPGSARVLPAHLESNFISPAFRGAQPAACLRSPREALDGRSSGASNGGQPSSDAAAANGSSLGALGLLGGIESPAPRARLVT